MSQKKVSVYGNVKVYRKIWKTRKDGVRQRYRTRRPNKSKRFDLKGTGTQLKQAVAVLKEHNVAPQKRFNEINLKGQTKQEIEAELEPFFSEDDWIDDESGVQS